jgi:protein-tyrosine phosphatase
MSFRAVRLPGDVQGQLWLASMPGRFEGWAEFEERARRSRLNLVVCLTPPSEVQELSPQYHAAVTGGTAGFRWLNVPIRNFGVPHDADGFRRAVADITQALREGESVMLHCAAGIGRTGTTAACVLKALGLPSADALQRVRDAGSNPENASQSGLVDWF